MSDQTASLEAAKARFPEAHTFQFGDGPELSAALLALVRAGEKTATCGALRDFDPVHEPLPTPGKVDIALTWDGCPSVAIETLSVEIMRFCDISEDFALAEGEGDYDQWRQGHEAYFARNGGFSADMMIVCERFKVVEVF